MKINFVDFDKKGNNDDVDVSPDKIEWTQVARNNPCVVKKRYGIEHFNDFEHKFAVKITEISNSSLAGRHMITIWSVKNDDVVIQAYVAQSQNHTDKWSIIFYERNRDNNQWVYKSQLLDLNKIYYISVIRKNKYSRLKIYNDPERMNLIDDSGEYKTIDVKYHTLTVFKSLDAVVDQNDYCSGEIFDYEISNYPEFNVLILGPSGDSFSFIKSEIKYLLSNMGIESSTNEDIIVPGKSIIDTIRSKIRNSNVIIADVTESNPNTLYEVGFAHALNKSVLLIVNNAEKQIPQDVRGYYYIIYDDDELDKLMTSVEAWVLNMEKNEYVWVS